MIETKASKVGRDAGLKPNYQQYAWQAVKSNDRLFKEFVYANIPLIKRIVSQILKRYPSISYNVYASTGEITFEDLVAEGVLGFYKAREKFDETVGVKFTTYASYWVRAYVEDALEKHMNNLLHTDEDTDETLKDILSSKATACTEDQVEEIMMEENIKKAIELLDPEYKKIIVMRFYEDKTLKEIADELHVSTFTVRQKLQKALEKMKSKLS